MNPGLWATLSDEGLRAQAEYLDVEINRGSEYDSFMHTVAGKFFMEELKSRLRLARDLYRHINPQHEKALVALSQLQSTENEVHEWINRIQTAQDRLKALGAQRQSLVEFAKHRKKVAEQRAFLPKSLEEGTKNATDRGTGTETTG